MRSGTGPPDGPDITAIVISLNSRRFLRDCLDSLRGAEWGGVTHEVIVVDNGSTDGSQEIVRREHPSVRLIANEANLGFCKASNQGAAAARGRYFLFLNDDILILGDALARLVEFMDAHPEAGLIGSRLLNPDGTDQFSSGRRFPTPANALFGRKSLLTRMFPRARWARAYLLSDKVEAPEPYEVDWISAAAMMVRRDVFAKLGGLAEDFYYFHELVFCGRAMRAGYRVYLDPQSKIIHYEGAGSGVRTRRVRRRHIEHFHVGAFRWFCLHHGIGRYNPLRAPVAAVLFLRAASLIAVDFFRPASPDVATQLKAGRPEGGIPP